jgi:fructose-1-phosphate kinase PfkB-like protein
MTYQITQIQQTEYPEIGTKVTEVSQDVIKENFSSWLNKCDTLAKSGNYIISIGAYRKLRKYYKAELTPIQAVTKICM